MERLPRASRLLFDRLDDHLDRVSRGTLIRPEIAALVRDNLRRHDGRGHRLLAYCVMPNHVHALIRRPTTARPAEPGMLGEQPDATGALARLMRSWKDASADWHPESYVHLVTDAEELSRLVEYIAYNPVKAGLVRQAHEWPWCSAHDRFHADGRETAWLPTDYELP